MALIILYIYVVYCQNIQFNHSAVKFEEWAFRGEGYILISIFNFELLVYNWLQSLTASLEENYRDVIENKWIIWVIVLIALIGGIGYAFYCTSKGYTFSGKVKWNWPRVWDIGIGCKP